MKHPGNESSEDEEGTEINQTPGIFFLNKIFYDFNHSTYNINSIIFSTDDDQKDVDTFRAFLKKHIQPDNKQNSSGSS